MKKFMSGLKKNNLGVSLIEMIVVVAIMSVLIGTVSLGLGMASTRSATECAEKMGISLNRARTAVMGKQRGYLAFYGDSEGNIYVVERYDEDYAPLTDGDMNSHVGTKIGKKGITVTSGGVTLTSSPNTPVYFEFSRSDGSLKTTSIANSPIKVSKGSRRYTVEVQPLTGKVTVTKG